MPPSPPRIWSTRRARWLLNLYPPFLVGRTRVVEIAEDFSTAHIRVSRSLLNRNLNRTIFGGTLFAAADPIHAILYWQRFARRGIHVQTWLKSARIEYRKPATSAVEYLFEVPDEEIEAGLDELERNGKFLRVHRVEGRGRGGDVVTVVDLEVYVRRLPSRGEVAEPLRKDFSA